jgi:lipoyl(octanoyl) transferase
MRKQAQLQKVPQLVAHRLSHRIEPEIGGLRTPARSLLPAADGPPVEWLVAEGSVAYLDAVAGMEAHVAAIAGGNACERIWLVEHPPLYTAGTSARAGDLLVPDRFPVFAAGRGGQYTYHGPGQRVGYVMLDLNRRRQDLRLYVATLEEWIIRTLAAFDVRGERREDRIGIWVERPELGVGREDKIAAIGIRIRKWVTFHGLALNVDPELEHFSGIVPCGVRGQGVTSLADLGRRVSMAEVDTVLRREFEALFGETAPPGPTA